MSFEESMKSKIVSNRSLLIVIIAGLALSATFLFYFIPKRSAMSAPTPLINNSAIIPNQTEVGLPIDQTSLGLPIRLKIPSINVDATIESVGLKANGEMDVPKDTANVAWFNLGPTPGQIGSAVIAGHFGILENGDGSVFDDLKKLKKDDKIYIENNSGVTITFTVRENRSYDADADASSVFTSSDGKSHLNLVTCQGWDKTSESYTKRFVVFADKE